MDWQAWIRGFLRSWTTWVGSLIVVMPQLLDALAPLVTETWGPEVWKRTLQIVGVVMILLRVKTTESIPDKGAPK